MLTYDEIYSEMMELANIDFKTAMKRMINDLKENMSTMKKKLKQKPNYST
jgi:predicted RNA-binding protein with RPS1 domain